MLFALTFLGNSSKLAENFEYSNAKQLLLGFIFILFVFLSFTTTS